MFNLGGRGKEQSSLAAKGYIGAIDQGTSSTKFILYNALGEEIAKHQIEHKQYTENAGWVEHDPEEIWKNTEDCIKEVMKSTTLDPSSIKAIGITNQRESTMMWKKSTGRPYHKIIVWNDTRTMDIIEELKALPATGPNKNEGEDSIVFAAGIDRYREITGLPLAPYFSASKILWLLREYPQIREDIEKGDVAFGTLDSWLVWNLTKGKYHVTDITNASRTLFMNLKTLQWEDSILNELAIDASILPKIVSSSDDIAICDETSVLSNVPITGILGDQQAALFGQACLSTGEAKCTYGTGAFLLMHTGRKICPSTSGLLTTPAYRFKNQPAEYALEGAVAYCGSLIQWLRDNVNFIDKASESESLALQVEDNGGLVFVPAFSGLFAPYWRSDARGCIVGLTQYHTKEHITRAALEAASFQVQEVLQAIERDTCIKLKLLKVDGGMTANNLAMQFQSDILQVPVITSTIMESTALGAAFAAGRTINYWGKELGDLWNQGTSWNPQMEPEKVNTLLDSWQKGITKSKNWVEQVDEVESRIEQVDEAKSPSQYGENNNRKDQNNFVKSMSWMALGASIAIVTTVLLNRYKNH